MQQHTVPHKLLCALAIFTSLLSGCAGRAPIRAGFAGELTGKQSDLGVHGRNGAQLAVDTLNAAGGIGGRPIELVVRDDKGTAVGAQAADRDLLAQRVVAIIGHMASAPTLAGLEVTQPAGVVLLSPAASTPVLSGKDDLFFRITPTHLAQAAAFARYIVKQRGLSRLGIVCDTDNASYSESYADTAVKIAQRYGGQVALRLNYSSSRQPDFAQMAAQLRSANPDALLIIAPPLDTAFLAQQTRLSKWNAPLFTSAWAQTEIFIQNGGQAVEGAEMVLAYDANSQAPAYQDFKARYQARFDRAPTFAAGEAYEAVLVLAAALNKTRGQAQGLPQALLSTQNFAGLIGPISMDRYGDVVRPLFLLTVRQGGFVTLGTLEPEAE